MVRIVKLAVLTAALMMLAPHVAVAGEHTLTAPYSSADTRTRCEDCTERWVISDARTGRVQSLSSVERAAFDTRAGLAGTTGRVFDDISASRKTRSINATVVVDVAHAAATLSGAGSNSGAQARLSAYLFVWCSGCEGGFRTVEGTVVYVDTNPATATPASISNTSVSIPLSLTLAAGEKLDGAIFVHLESHTFASLGAQTVALSERAASASSDVRLSSIKIVTTDG